MQAKSLLKDSGFGKLFGFKYPCGYPLLISPLVFLFGHNFMPIKFLSIILCIGLLLLLYNLIKKELPGERIFLFLFFILLNSTILQFSATVLTEVPYLFFSVLFLVFAKREAGFKNLFITAMLAAACFYIKTIGILLFISYLTFLIISKNNTGLSKSRQIIIFTILILCLISPYFLFKNFTAYQRETFQDYKSLGLENIVIPNLKYYLINIPISLYSDSSNLKTFLMNRGAFSVFNWFIICSIIFLIFYAYIEKISSKKISTVEIYVLLYILTFMLWPYQDIRFIMPIIPFMYFYLLCGFQSIEKKSTKGKIFAKILITIILTFQVFSAAGVIENSLYLKAPTNNLPLKSYSWIKKNTDKTTYILSLYLSTELYADRRVLVARLSNFSYKDIIERIFLSKADYILLETEPQLHLISQAQRQSYFNYSDALCFNPLKFKLVYENSEEHTKIFRVLSDGSNFFKALEYFKKIPYPVEEKNIKEAIGLCKKCIFHDSNFFEAYLHLGILQIKQNKFSQAVKTLEKLIKRNPYYLEAYLILAYAYKNNKEDRKAIELLKKAKSISRLQGRVLNFKDFSE